MNATITSETKTTQDKLTIKIICKKFMLLQILYGEVSESIANLCRNNGYDKNDILIDMIKNSSGAFLKCHACIVDLSELDSIFIKPSVVNSIKSKAITDKNLKLKSREFGNIITREIWKTIIFMDKDFCDFINREPNNLHDINLDNDSSNKDEKEIAIRKITKICDDILDNEISIVLDIYLYQHLYRLMSNYHFNERYLLEVRALPVVKLYFVYSIWEVLEMAKPLFEDYVNSINRLYKMFWKLVEDLDCGEYLKLNINVQSFSSTGLISDLVKICIDYIDGPPHREDVMKQLLKLV